ncbi:MAG: glycosyltransferase [Thermodesulfobacteriaceae bacterium]|nr:glycosyltransferase [Thermodesulfobacteriaceae bacterium]
MKHFFYDEFLRPSQQEIEEFVESIWGPIILMYLYKLNLILQTLSYRRDLKVLFCYPSGLRIFDLWQTYLGARDQNLNLDYDFLKISRCLSAKILYLKDPLLCQKFFEKLYHNRAHYIYYALLNKEVEKTCSSVGELFREQEILEILQREALAFENYFRKLVGDKKTIVLVDEGWSGTIQLPLEIVFPEYEFYSFYFGCLKPFEFEGRTAKNLRGLIFEAKEGLFIPEKPETAFIFNLPFLKNFFSTGEKALIISKTKEYLQNLSNSLTKLVQLINSYQGAINLLKSKIINPKLKDLKLLKGCFPDPKKGEIEKVFLLPPMDRFLEDSSYKRIEEAGWIFGQILLEYIDKPFEREALIDFYLKKNSLLEKTLYFTEYLIDKKSQEAFSSYIFKEELKYDFSKKVAIILRTKDRPLLLRRALKGITSQLLQNFELVIVNDGGRIDLVLMALLESFIDPSKVKIVNHLKSKGAEGASNAGIRATKSKYLHIHDDDDFLYPEFLEKTVTFLEKNSRYKGVVTYVFQITEEILGTETKELKKEIYKPDFITIDLSRLCSTNYILPIAFLFEREVYDKIGGFDENLPALGDWDFYLRFQLEADIGVLPEVLADHYVRTTVPSCSCYGSATTIGRILHYQDLSYLKNKYLRLAMQNPKFLTLALLFNFGYFHSDIKRSITNLI